MLQLFILLVLTTVTYCWYDENLARNKMVKLAMAANTNDINQGCLNKLLDSFQLVDTVKVKCDGDWFTKDCMGYVAISEKERAIAVSFRGTVSLKQLEQEIKQTIERSQVQMFSFFSMIDEYFAKTFNLFWNDKFTLKMLEQINTHPNYQIWITGHSLGGAIAHIYATKLGVDNNFGDRIKLYTFGQPRVGNKQYANLHNQKIKESYRIVHLKDPVPNMPLYGLLIRPYQHTDEEVFYNNNMTETDPFRLCKAEDNTTLCHKGNSPFSVVDHITYFGLDFSKHCEKQ